ncbi:amidase [Mycobacterium sp. NPDC003449]
MDQTADPIERALATATLDRFNAWTTVNRNVLAQYEQSARENPGAERALAGLPCGIKDNIDVAGLPTGAGSAYPPVTPTHDAGVVNALRRAGAAIIGKNAMHEIAYGSTGMVSANEPANNPRATTRIPGGSSSGSAAAVAAGDVPVALGTDTGGSVRVPAALCGVVGLRPTTKSLDSSGASPLSSTLDTVGILAATVELAKTVWHTVSGGGPTPQRDAGEPLRVGVIVDEYIADTCQATREAVVKATELLANYGYPVSPVHLGWLSTALPVYSDIVGTEAAWVHRLRLSAPSHLFQPATYQRLLAGRHVPGWRYFEAMRQRERMRDALLGVFDEHDVLVCPTTPVTAPRLNQSTVEQRGRCLDVGRALISYTVPWSLTDAPSLALPISRDPDSLPTSIQIVGRPGDETSVLNAGAVIEAQLAPR